MSYLELGAIGELIAALATVITLIYLSKQIHTNNKLAISNLENKLNSRVYDRRFTVARDKEFAAAAEAEAAKKAQVSYFFILSRIFFLKYFFRHFF